MNQLMNQSSVPRTAHREIKSILVCLTSSFSYLLFLLILEIHKTKYHLECSNFARSGFRLSYSLTLKSRRASDAADCEEICLRETQFQCRTFAFKQAQMKSKMRRILHFLDKS